MKDNLFNIYQFRNLNNPNVYYNSDIQRILQNYRMLFLYLSDEYLNSKDVKEILTYMNHVMPDDVIKIQRNPLKLYTAEKYLSVGMLENYNRIIDGMVDNNNDVFSNIEIAEYLSQIGDVRKSNFLIKKALNIYSDLTNNENLNLFLLTIEMDIKNQIPIYWEEDIESFKSSKLEDVIYDIVSKQLDKYKVDYKDKIILKALQILIANYIIEYE